MRAEPPRPRRATGARASAAAGRTRRATRAATGKGPGRRRGAQRAQPRRRGRSRRCPCGPLGALARVSAQSPGVMTTRVLIADDHPLTREALSGLLVANGFDVVGQAGDGAEAVAQAGVLQPDLVIL